MESDLFSAQGSLAGYMNAALATRSTAGAPVIAGSDPKQAAEDFEKFFLSQVLETMQSGESLQSAFGGGPGENAWKSFMNEAFADAIVQAGGIGLADRLMSEIIALQAEMSGAQAQPQSNLPSA